MNEDAKSPAPGDRTVTLSTGREVKVGPLQWSVFEPLVQSVFQSTARTLQELAASVDGIDGRTLGGAFFALLGDADRQSIFSSPRAIAWLVAGTVREPEVALGADGQPDLSGWSLDEVTELLPTILKLNDFARIGSRLKNSWLPVSRDLTGALAGNDEPDEGASPAGSATGTSS
jgi:hypothetical protein